MVIAVVILAIEAVLGRRLRSHITEEVFETLEPAVANNDSAAAILFPASVLGIVTARFNVGPSEIFRRRRIRLSVAAGVALTL
jgi:hypothetical protein